MKTKTFEFIEVNNKSKLKTFDNVNILVVNTIFTDWNNNLNPVIRSIKYALSGIKYTVFQAKIAINKQEEQYVVDKIKGSDYTHIIQVYDSYYFPRDFLIENIYKKLDIPIFYYCYDYNAYPFSKYIKYYEDNLITISNVANIKRFKPKKLYHINLNAFILKDKQIKADKPFDVIYYGSFRKNRITYFNKYLNNKVVLSTSKKNVSKYKDIDVTSPIIDIIDWRNPILKYFKYSLYIEDKYTHDNYNYLASRFYEALNYSVIPVFDVNCRNTIDKSGYNILEDYVIHSIDDINNLEYKEDYTEYLYKQAKKERQQVLKQFRNILLENT